MINYNIGNLTTKVFEFDKRNVSLEHEKLVPFYQQEIEDMGHEVYEIKGHQFMTSDGLYIITHKSEIEYGE